jgi:enolase
VTATKKRYGGMGVLKACRNVNDKIFKVIKGISADKQEEIDRAMLELDGTDNKRKLGANAILSVSLACARLAAKLHHKELFSYLAQVYGYTPKALPTPFFNVINGGKHADSGLDIQEFFIIPQKGNFAAKLRAGSEIFHQLKSQLAKKGFTVSVGDEGGFAPKLAGNEEALKQLSQAVAEAGYKLGKDVSLGMDAASSEFFDDKKGEYQLKSSKLSAKPSNIYQIYKKWLSKYPLMAIEDGCAEDDFLGWKFLTQNLGGQTLLIGDDLFVTNPVRIQMGITQKIANAVLIKVNQIGTLTETLAAIKLAQKNKYKIVISHRSGETSDSFIADLAVAVGAEYIKAGAPSRGERVAKYNRLLEIENLI